jgi:hypothetical protein
MLSNLPEGLSSASGLRLAGWTRARVARMWLIVTGVSAVSAALGRALLDPTHGHTGRSLNRARVAAATAGRNLARGCPTSDCDRAARLRG